MRSIVAVSVAVVCFACGITTAQQSSLNLKAENVMTAQELNNTGVATLSGAQRVAFDAWLNRYTLRVFEVAEKRSGGGCAPAIETRIAGDFNGWDGETVFKLDNGQIWEQATYAYTYHYAYRPEVTIYSSDSGCRMQVEGMDQNVSVKRIK